MDSPEVGGDQKHRAIWETFELGDYSKVIRLCNMAIHKRKNISFHKFMKSKCLNKQGKKKEAVDLAIEVRRSRPTDQTLVKQMLHLLLELEIYPEATLLLERYYKGREKNLELSQDLFYCYVRERKLSKQQNLSITVFQRLRTNRHSMWGVESMYQIARIQKFKTKLMDVAALLMEKIMRNPLFVNSVPFAYLFVKVHKHRKEYREALEFMANNDKLFPDKIAKRLLMAELEEDDGKLVPSVNHYFSILAEYCQADKFMEHWSAFQNSIRILLDRYVPTTKYEFKPNLDYLLNKSGLGHLNFEPIVGPRPPKLDYVMEEEEQDDGMQGMEGMEEGGEEKKEKKEEEEEEEPVTTGQEVMENLYNSIRNIRKNAPSAQKELAARMRRTSLHADLEFKRRMAYKLSAYNTSMNSPFANTIQDYIDMLYERYDVSRELIPYMKFLTTDSLEAIKEKIRVKCANLDNFRMEVNGRYVYCDLKSFRLKTLYYKLTRRLRGFQAFPSLLARLETVFQMLNLYIDSHYFPNRKDFTELDHRHFDDLIFIIVQILKESRAYDNCILNPVNYLIILILEFVRHKNPHNEHFAILLSKYYSKLGCSLAVNRLFKNIAHKGDHYESIGYYWFSHLSEFCAPMELESFCNEITQFFESKCVRLKYSLVDFYRHENFAPISGIMDQDDKLNRSYLYYSAKVMRYFLQTSRNIESMTRVNQVIDKALPFLSEACLKDGDFTYDRPHPGLLEDSWKPLKLDSSRQELKQENIHRKHENDLLRTSMVRSYEVGEQVWKRNKISLFGFKQEKMLKLIAFAVRCLYQCTESKLDNVNNDLNNFLLVKNSISLNILQRKEKLLHLLDIIKHLTGDEGASFDKNTLEKVIKSAQYSEKDSPERIILDSNQQKVRTLQEEVTKMVDKILYKIEEHRQSLVKKREFSTLDLMKQLDPNDEMYKKFKNQANLRRCFLEEFKLQALNIVVLMLESVLRIQATQTEVSIEDWLEYEESGEADADRQAEEDAKKRKEEALQSGTYGLKPLKEDPSQKSVPPLQVKVPLIKRLQEFRFNCIGWEHVYRSILVLSMMIRDLIYTIVPTKIVVKQMVSQGGKIITSDSEYVLQEHIRKSTGKYPFEFYYTLDLKYPKEEEQKRLEEQKAKEEKKNKFKITGKLAQKPKDEKPPQNQHRLDDNKLFFHQHDDFSLMKLKATCFLIYWPLTFMISSIKMWLRNLPQPLVHLSVRKGQKFTDVEQQAYLENEYIKKTRDIVRQFLNEAIMNITNLLEYLNESRAAFIKMPQIEAIDEIPAIKKFYRVFDQIEDIDSQFFKSVKERMQRSYTFNMDNALKMLELRLESLKNINYKP